jgi:hypothetical protein
LHLRPRLRWPAAERGRDDLRNRLLRVTGLARRA